MSKASESKNNEFVNEDLLSLVFTNTQRDLALELFRVFVRVALIPAGKDAHVKAYFMEIMKVYSAHISPSCFNTSNIIELVNKDLVQFNEVLQRYNQEYGLTKASWLEAAEVLNQAIPMVMSNSLTIQALREIKQRYTDLDTNCRSLVQIIEKLQNLVKMQAQIVNFVTKGYTPLDCALSMGLEDTASLLIDKGAFLNSRAIDLEINDEKFDIIREKIFAHTILKQEISEEDEKHISSPIRLAFSKVDSLLIKKMIENGAEIRKSDLSYFKSREEETRTEILAILINGFLDQDDEDSLVASQYKVAAKLILQNDPEIINTDIISGYIEVSEPFKNLVNALSDKSMVATDETDESSDIAASGYAEGTAAGTHGEDVLSDSAEQIEASLIGMSI